ncbi:DUF2147 domain-containing protein [Chelativorans salis]|uniref:DUF2147 domain-containing protein n=1 Tax=Chelativorans salis TaxID=2978478 RepID=A0ABT2LQW4_9HYPH|nr:DUF2147 domain-containing protein [Chelativorans sp. EGI FJ00035]MCT7376018.1 DUF2147 domain-containing protein [Chelativorans sp. EGI FJ00035]
MIRRMFFAGAALLAAMGPALADPIEGRWKTGSGNTAEISACGGAFCITLKTGPHAGKQIGRFEPQGEGSYAGTVTDPNKDKTYKGKGSLEGNVFTMGGCVLGGLICRNETWSRM